jgi:hypothetical protein
MTTGLRAGELVALYGHLEREVAKLEEAYAWHWRAVGWVLEQPKTEASVRSVALSRLAVSGLRAERRWQAEMRLRLEAAWEDNDLVFCAR